MSEMLLVTAAIPGLEPAGTAALLCELTVGRAIGENEHCLPLRSDTSASARDAGAIDGMELRAAMVTAAAWLWHLLGR